MVRDTTKDICSGQGHHKRYLPWSGTPQKISAVVRDTTKDELRTPRQSHESVAYPGIFFGGGVQQIQLRTEDRENGNLGAVAP